MSGKYKRRRKGSSVFLAVGAVLGLVLLSSGFSTLAAQAAGGEDNSKVFVCKYVGKPGVDERLQTGNNPISVSISSILNYPGLGQFFKDGQNRSFVLREDDTPPGPEGDPSVGECPAPDGPDEIPVPTVPVSDPCGSNNAVYGAVPSGNYDVQRNGDGSITLTAHDGYAFPGDKTSVTLPAPTETNTEPCPPEVTVIEIPAAPSPNDPCGPGNATWSAPADTDTLNWELLPSGHLTVTIIPANTTFPSGATSHDYGLAVDSGKQCPPEPTPVAPAEPLQLDVCEPPSGPTSDEYTIPVDSNFIYTVNGVTTASGTYPGSLDTYVIKAVAKQGVVVKEGAVTEWTLEFSRAACLTSPDPVVSPDGSISVDCQGKGVAVADNSASTTSVGFEVVVNGHATLYSLRAGKVRHIPFSGAQPGSKVVLQDGEANELDSARVPVRCGGDVTPPDNTGISNTPTSAHTGLWSEPAASQSSGVAQLCAALAGLLLLMSGFFFYGAWRRGQEN